MKYYPVFMNVKDKSCLVVGGGSVGLRKAAMLQKCGANVRVVSESFAKGSDEIPTNIVLEKKKYTPTDIRNAFFIFAATNNANVNQQVKRDAQQHEILCNIADAPESSDFILPSVVDRGDLVIAVSTSGKSPAMTRNIRQVLETMFGKEYEDVLVLLGNIRKKLRMENKTPPIKGIFAALMRRNILEKIRIKDAQKINAMLNEVLGKDYTYKELMSTKKP